MQNQRYAPSQKSMGLTLDLDKLTHQRYSTISTDDNLLFNASPKDSNMMSTRVPKSTTNFKVFTLEEQLRSVQMNTSRNAKQGGLRGPKQNLTARTGNTAQKFAIKQTKNDGYGNTVNKITEGTISGYRTSCRTCKDLDVTNETI